MKKLLILFILFSVFACSIKVTTRHDETADFSKYKTYQLNEETFKLQVVEENRAMVLAAIEKGMKAEGLSKSDNPDLLVNVLIAGKEVEKNSIASNNFYYDNDTEGTLLITFIDKSNDKIVWQGAGQKAILQEAPQAKREANMNTAVERILKDYPPTK